MTEVINRSLTSGVFPQAHKAAIVKPLLKKPSLDHNNLKNYRPVSNLSFVSKLTEKIILSQLFGHLTKNELFNPFQSAYRPGHSTETALLKVMNDLLHSLDKGKISLVTMLDLSAAFDTIDHTILLQRLEHVFGIRGTALSWFASYLSDRTQTVSIENFTSADSPLPFGVPQGSVLGPVLFVLYTAPLSDIMKNHSVLYHAYADDSQLQKSAPQEDANELVQSMQACIQDVKSWMTSNKLKLNDDKTEAMIVSSSRLISSAPLPDSLVAGDSSVQFAQSVKNLGVTLDMHLTMVPHIVNLIRSANLELRRISSIRHFLSTYATQTLVSAFVLSRLDYCNSLLFGCPQYLIDKLQKVQNNAARLVSRARKTDHVTPLLRQLHWLPVESRIRYKISSLCFSIVSSTGPAYLSDLLELYTPSRLLRSSSDNRIFKIPTTRTKSFGQRCFSFSGPTIWNTLPKDIRLSQTATSFKSKLKTHLFPA